MPRDGAAFNDRLNDLEAKPVNNQTGTAYTLVLDDAGNVVTMSNAAASTLTIPANASVAFPVGTEIDVVRLGAGQVTLTAGGGVTLRATPGPNFTAQYGAARLIKIATNEWVATGSLAV